MIALTLPTAGTFTGEAVRVLLTGAGFLLLFVAAEVWLRALNPPVEWTRKLVHFGGGIVAAVFPWIFGSHWTVLGLALLFVVVLWETRRRGLLGSVHGVERRSEGALYYPAAIYLLFVIGAGRPVFYMIAVLALVVSDTVAAVLGSAYGRVRYVVEADRRTVEGSAVFFLSTFLVVHLPLLLMTDTPRAISVLVALQLALLVTLVEGISIKGNDNLVVPLMTFYLLVKLTRRTAEFLLYQLSAQLVIMALLGLIAWRYHFVTASGAMGLMLFFYGVYALGGEEWIVAPALALVGFSVFYLFRCRPAGYGNVQYQVIALFYVAVVPVTLFLANNAFETLLPGPAFLRTGDPFYPAFLGAVAAQLALIVYNLDPATRSRRRAARVAVLAGAGAFAATVLPGLIVWSPAVRLRDLLIPAAVLLVASALYHSLWRSGRWPHRRFWNVRLQSLSVAGAVLVLLPVILRAAR
ncbi:MAG: hypothetical protein ABIV11_10650 [Gemmatimonadaceae bacterium]